MPLNITVTNPGGFSGAVLENVPTMAEVMSGLNGLVGLWVPGGLPDGPVSSLAPAYGDSALTAVGTVNKITLEGEAALAMDAANTRMADTWNSGSGTGTIFAKFYLRDPVNDFQNIIGPAGQRILYRSEESAFPTGVHLSTTTDITGMALKNPEVGWHTAEMYLGGGRIIVAIDGVEYTSDPWDGVLNGNLVFGNQPAASAVTSVAFGSMFATNDFLHNTPAASAIRSYMFG